MACTPTRCATYPPLPAAFCGACHDCAGHYVWGACDQCQRLEPGRCVACHRATDAPPAAVVFDGQPESWVVCSLACELAERGCEPDLAYTRTSPEGDCPACGGALAAAAVAA